MTYEMREEDLKTLTSIGLSRNESAIFLDLLRNGMSSAVDVAGRVGVHRPNIYDSLRRLKEMGLIIEIIDGSGKVFKALDPERLKLYLQQRQEDVNRLIDELKKIPKKESVDKGVVSLCEGIAVKRELLNLFDLGEQILVSFHEDCKVLGNDFFKGLNEERIQRKIPMKIIMYTEDDKRIENLNLIPYVKAKKIKFVTSPKFVTIIVGNTIYYVFSDGDENNLIKINQSDLADEKRLHFEFAWENATNPQEF